MGKILKKAKIPKEKRVEQLKSEEMQAITKALDEIKTEGDLRQEVSQSIKRLKTIGSYRGYRHLQGLPVRGQRTRTNARTKRGKRVTIGALRRKEVASREQVGQEKEKGKEA